MPATCEKLESGYRLSNELFEAIISFAGPTIGLTHLSHRGDVKREPIKVTEAPLTLRLATDAPRIDFPDWNFHCTSGTDVPPEADWGTQLGLFKQPTSGGPRAQRLTDTLVGPPWYTDIYYPGYCWYRRMVELPKEWKGKPIVFVLGGCDEFDWRAYWVYLNGERIGQTSYDDTYNSAWHDTPRYVLKPDDALYKNLKFGAENLLSVQARGLDRRTPEMNRLDLERYSGQSMLCDQYVSAGEPTRDVSGFTVVSCRQVDDNGAVALEMQLAHPTEHLSITARYWLQPNESALHKRITVHNEGNETITLLEADVMSLSMEKQPITGGGQGWPARIGEDWFAGVSHPAGVARFDNKGIKLQVIPGVALDPTHSHDYTSKTAVIGVGNGRRAFSEYLQAHSRRKPQFLNMYSLYGLCEIASGIYPKVELTEELVTKNLVQMRDLQKRDIRFDYYCIDTGWNDPAGDLKTFHPANFPKGPGKSLKTIHELGMKPLLWMSPAAGPAVFRGSGNPLVPPDSESNNGTWGFFCLLGEKWRTILREAMLHHVRNNGVRGFKLDEVTFYCGRTTHGHLPNKYGIEAEMDAFIDTLDRVRAECPDVLYMLYWRFMSPWWLLHADTIYQRGVLMEGSTPSAQPSRLTRESATISLDQGHDWNWDKMPLIGQDSLGVWLSDTRWGSWMGAEGWRDAWIMDFVRGNMMHQLWGNLGFLNEEDLKFMEAIARWTRENWQLLKNPKRIAGSPWRGEPYGYSCFDGEHGVVVIHNANFPLAKVRVPLNDSVAHEVRWIYKAGEIQHELKQFVSAGEPFEIELGSFEVAMAEITPAKNGATTQAAKKIPQRDAATRIHARFSQTAYRKLDWADPKDSETLARVVNGRTTPTTSPQVLAAGPDRSDERDRDAIVEALVGGVTIPARSSPSKLLVVARFERDGIAWHHLGPHEIVHVKATIDGKALEARVNPRRWHEEAGAWCWILHEFDIPAAGGNVDISINAARPKTVAMFMDVWQSDS